MASRRIEDLTFKMQELCYLFSEKMYEKDLPFIITCTSRTISEQVVLFAQGRNPLEYVNQLRKSIGFPLITETQNKVVTWTMKSRHLVNYVFPKSRAFDICLLVSGKPSWDIKISINDNEIPDYDEAGAIGESVGLKWGGSFKKKDRPHYEDYDPD